LAYRPRIARAANYALAFLAPYSPELNPVEHLREHLRENYIGNRVFASLDAVIQQFYIGLHNLHRQPKLVQSMTCFDWLKTLTLKLNWYQNASE
jgi:transposase